MFVHLATISALVVTLTLTSAHPTNRVYTGASSTVSGPGLEYYSSSLSLPLPSISTDSTTYQCYNGDVSNYPPISSWLSFTHLWKLNKPAITSSNGFDRDIPTYILDAITAISNASLVDARVILAIIMQESSGAADVPCTGNGNCGLMQGPIGSVNFDGDDPKQSVLQMVTDGVQGTSQAPGLAQYIGGGLGWVSNPDGNVFVAARLYNSGSVAAGGDLDDVNVGVASYANDVANRLLGWVDDGGANFAGQCE